MFVVDTARLLTYYDCSTIMEAYDSPVSMLRKHAAFSPPSDPFPTNSRFPTVTHSSPKFVSTHNSLKPLGSRPLLDCMQLFRHPFSDEIKSVFLENSDLNASDESLDRCFALQVRSGDGKPSTLYMVAESKESCENWCDVLMITAMLVCSRGMHHLTLSVEIPSVGRRPSAEISPVFDAPSVFPSKSPLTCQANLISMQTARKCFIQTAPPWMR